MNQFGFIRVSVLSPKVAVANPKANAQILSAEIRKLADSDVIVTPELALTAYTCGDLFRSTILLDKAEAAVGRLAEETKATGQLVLVGAPVRVGPDLFNCAIALAMGKIVGIIPKQNIPGYCEFYEPRWFAAANGYEPEEISYAGQAAIPFGTELMFLRNGDRDLRIFVEICEDLWMPVPPSSIAALHGANVLLNLSASPEKVGSDEYRMELVRNQSARSIAAYAYASSGPSESTADLVFSGHCIITENGTTLAESDHIGDGQLKFGPRSATADVDYEKLNTERRIQRTFGDQMRQFPRTYREIQCTFGVEQKDLKRKVVAFPFVPSNPATLQKRCAAVFDIQCAGLAKRLEMLKFHQINIGVSGGLDSTHALLVAHKTLAALKAQGVDVSPTLIHAKTMPGFGTTGKTKAIAHTIMKELGVTVDEIDIRRACLQMFRDLKHKPFGIDISACNSVEQFTEMLTRVPPDKRHDLVFENVQAGIRTSILMRSGFTLGTGDLSELALGWCTYGVGDHMSHYNVNCSVPKTLIAFLVKYVALNHYGQGKLRNALIECAGLTISPELLPPGADGEILQSTEDVLGPYALHDFFLFNTMRYGFSPAKIQFLAGLAPEFSAMDISRALKIFTHRFFSQQFKRDAVPNGPKVGSVSLSPRGDWRMPSDVDPKIWMADME